MKTTKIPLLIVLMALLLSLSSCLDELFLEGNGRLETEYRTDAGFSGISSNGDFQVTVMPGNRYSVEVTAESNLLNYIETDVIDHTLRIRTSGNRILDHCKPIEIYITTPVLSGLTLSGSGQIYTGGFSSDEFQILLSGSGNIDTQISADVISANISGSGTVLMEGDAYETDFRISGSGKIKSYDLLQDHCQASISGSGDMYVNASETLDASISGSGFVYYISRPAIRSNISGSGKVINKN